MGETPPGFRTLSADHMTWAVEEFEYDEFSRLGRIDPFRCMYRFLRWEM